VQQNSGSHVDPAVAHLKVRGEVDLASVRQIRSGVAAAIVDGYTVLRLDLEEVSFMDCTGVSSLLASMADAHAGGAQLTLHAIPERVSRLLELTGTTGRLTEPRSA
jgi:anti-sigma B factor antagonist